VLYVRGCRQPLRLSLGNQDDPEYELRQFDPRSGKFSKPIASQEQAQIEYTPPDDRDWVLVVTAASQGLN
jgi:hypothetical protein